MLSNPNVRRLSRYDELADIASYKSKLTPEQYQWLLDHYVKPELRQDFRALPDLAPEEKRRIARRHKARRRDAFEHPAQDGSSPIVHSVDYTPSLDALHDAALDLEKIITRK